LAVWGITEQAYLLALGSLLDLTAEFSIDLIRVEEAPERLRRRIDRDGVML
jgi:hypothetical protein